MSADPAATRSGYVTLLGQPNAGKSTLLNAFVGEKLSIVTAKAQTTWQRVTGIVSTAAAQMIFLDTPGLLEAKDLLQRAMLEQAHGAIAEADVLLVVIDARAPLEEARLAQAIAPARAPRFAAVNKIDVVPRERVDERLRWAERTLGAHAFPVSALRGTGVDALRSALAGALPAGPFLYPPDEIASDPVRFFVAELVRESVFERYRQEVPYSIFCRVEEFREEQDPIYIQVGLFVERESQKGIVVGKRGAGIRELGRQSREKIEHFLGRSVYLELWVKTLPDWRRKRGDLARLGFRVPDEPR